jgi:predicted small secreted protein
MRRAIVLPVAVAALTFGTAACGVAEDVQQQAEEEVEQLRTQAEEEVERLRTRVEDREKEADRIDGQ